MKNFRKNLFLGLIIIAAAITGYFIQETEQQSYVLELGTRAKESSPPQSVQDSSPQTAADIPSDTPTPAADAAIEPTSSAAPAATDKVNLNTATKEELKTLSGIGDSRAEKIIQYRAQHKFEVIEDIMKISGIGRKTFEKLKNNITV